MLAATRKQWEPHKPFRQTEEPASPKTRLKTFVITRWDLKGARIRPRNRKRQMGDSLGRILVDPIERVLSNFNELCFGTGCELDSGCSQCCTLHIATGAHESLETEQTEDGDLHNSEHECK